MIVPSLILNMVNPYNKKSYDEILLMWKSVYNNFKDKEHAPPFELAYASYLNLITHVKKSSKCNNCNNELNGNGVYFPLEDNHIMPLTCCEKCCEKRNYIFVNKLQRPIKFYSWKMIISANLVVPMYKNLKKEEKEELLKYNFKEYIPENMYNNDIILNNVNNNYLFEINDNNENNNGLYILISCLSTLFITLFLLINL